MVAYSYDVVNFICKTTKILGQHIIVLLAKNKASSREIAMCQLLSYNASIL